MNCETEFDPLAFHFGQLTEAERNLAESHLLGCRECLAGYFALKRSFEEESENLAPSSAAKRALFEEVERTFAKPRFLSMPRWATAAAFAVALVALSVWGGSRLWPKPLPKPATPDVQSTQVDMSTSTAENMHFI